MARKSTRATRLPSGLYGFRGKARAFSALPQGERHRFRSLWAHKGQVTRHRELRAARREVVVVGPAPIREERFYGVQADVPQGEMSLGQISRMVREKADETPGARSWYARLEWAPDHKGGPPKQTVFSFPFKDPSEAERQSFVARLQQIMEQPSLLANKHGSKGKGKPKVVEIGAMTPTPARVRSARERRALLELRKAKAEADLEARAERAEREAAELAKRKPPRKRKRKARRRRK